MSKMEVTNKSPRQLLPNTKACEEIPMLLEKHYGIQMANIWKFGISTGLRLRDMLAIKFVNISGDKALVTMHKYCTGETKEIFLSSEALEVINSIKKEHPKSEYLFQSHRSRNVINKKSSPVTRQTVSFAFREVGRILDIRLTPHMMRKICILRSIDQFSPSEHKLMQTFLTR